MGFIPPYIPPRAISEPKCPTQRSESVPVSTLGAHFGLSWVLLGASLLRLYLRFLPHVASGGFVAVRELTLWHRHRKNIGFTEVKPTIFEHFTFYSLLSGHGKNLVLSALEWSLGCSWGALGRPQGPKRDPKSLSTSDPGPLLAPFLCLAET